MREALPDLNMDQSLNPVRETAECENKTKESDGSGFAGPGNLVIERDVGEKAHFNSK
jgi:hypothetical protein